MAIDVGSLPPWAQKQIAEKLLNAEREKAPKFATGAKKRPHTRKDTTETEKCDRTQISPPKCEIKVTIHLPPVTKKNSQRIVQRGNRHIPLPSKAYAKYEEAAGVEIAELVGKCINTPIAVKCLFYMPTRRKVDLTNLLEATDDVLVHYQVVADDNSRIIVHHDGSRVLYDKENPRTEIEITPYDGD